MFICKILLSSLKDTIAKAKYLNSQSNSHLNYFQIVTFVPLKLLKNLGNLNLHHGICKFYFGNIF